MRVLVTGGLGFVGRNVTYSLLQNNHDVVIVDSLLEGSGGLHPSTLPQKFRETFSELEILYRDTRQLDSVFLSRFDVVILLAAVVGGRLTIEYRPLAVAEDLELDSRIIREWNLGNIKHLIYASSSAAYPVSLQRVSGYRLKESDIDFSSDLGLPDTSYGWSKLTGEFLLSLGKNNNTGKVTVIRPFSGYGNDQDLAYPFPSILRRVHEHSENSEAFQVWGSGLQERDFVYINDVVAFLRAISESSLEGVFNIATGVATSFRQLAGYLLHMKGFFDHKVIGKSEMPEGVFSRVGSTDLYYSALTQLGLSKPLSVETVIQENYAQWIEEIESNG